MHRPRVWARIGTAMLLLAAAAVASAAEVKLTKIERRGFSISVPDYFILDPDPTDTRPLDAWSPAETDRRGLSWSMSLRVEREVGANPEHLSIQQLTPRVLGRIREVFESKLTAGPAGKTGQITSGEDSLLVAYRTNEKGLHTRRFDLYVCDGVDLLTVTASVAARAGSEVLEKEHPSYNLLRDALLSFAIVRSGSSEAASQPTTRPATTSVSHK